MARTCTHIFLPLLPLVILVLFRPSFTLILHLALIFAVSITYPPPLHAECADVWVSGYLARGVVILISIALGAGVVFLMGLLGVLWALFRRRDERNYVQDPATDEKEYDDDLDSLQRPSSLLAHINAATRNTIFMPKDMEVSSHADVAGHKAEETAVDHSDQAHVLRGDSISHEGTLAAGAGAALISGSQSPVTTVDEHDVNRPAQARHSFEGEGEGELPLKTGQDVIVLNNQDPMCVSVASM
jgi:hypothetical protein